MRARFCSQMGIMAALAVGSLIILPAPAAAQSLFETLFGPAKPSPSRLLPPTGINAGQPYKVRPQPYEREERYSPRTEQRGSYHTVCVRMCDGYYWPISYSASRSRLYKDANVCASSCGSEAKLFHYRDHGSIQDAVDLSGLAYTRLPNAFKYRKAMVDGCACRPAPWSEAEIDRHRVYALNAEAAAGKAPAPGAVAAIPVPPPSGKEESLSSSAATEFTAAPAKQPEVAELPTGKTVVPQPADRKPPSRSARSEPEGGKPHGRRSSPSQVAAATAPRKTSGGSDGGFFGFGGQSSSKLVWPGDAPRRVR